MTELSHIDLMLRAGIVDGVIEIRDGDNAVAVSEQNFFQTVHQITTELQHGTADPAREAQYSEILDAINKLPGWGE
jgi:hypothetical protein